MLSPFLIINLYLPIAKLNSARISSLKVLKENNRKKAEMRRFTSVMEVTKAYQKKGLIKHEWSCVATALNK